MRIIRLVYTSNHLFLRILSHSICIIVYFCAGPMPANIPLGRLFLRVHEDLHAFVVETVWLAEVEHVEADFAGDLVSRPEEIPLSVASSVNVVLKEEKVVILFILHFEG